MKELGEMKKQLGVMQESKVKLFAVNTIQKVEPVSYTHLDVYKRQALQT